MRVRKLYFLTHTPIFPYIFLFSLVDIPYDMQLYQNDMHKMVCIIMFVILQREGKFILFKYLG